MKNLKQTILLSVVGLATIGTITGFALAGGVNNTGDTSESEVLKKVDISQKETSAETSEIITKFTDDVIVITDFDYTVSKQDILDIHTIRLNPEYNRVMIYYNKIDFSPTGIKTVDEEGNIGEAFYYDNMLAGSNNLDITSKHYTITLEFANNPEIGDVTIEITLP